MKSSELVKLIVELGPKYSLGIGLFGVVLLVLPIEITNFLDIEILRARYRGMISIVMLVAFAFWLFTHLHEYVNLKKEIKEMTNSALKTVAIEEKYDRVVRPHSLQKKLEFCSVPEKLIISYCLKKNQDIIYLPCQHAAVLALVEREIFKRPDTADESHSQVAPFKFDSNFFKALKHIEAGDTRCELTSIIDLGSDKLKNFEEKVKQYEENLISYNIEKV